MVNLSSEKASLVTKKVWFQKLFWPNEKQQKVESSLWIEEPLILSVAFDWYYEKKLFGHHVKTL